MDKREHQPEQQTAPYAIARVTRLTTGEYMVHKPVWTARVSMLRANAASTNTTLVVVIFAAVTLPLSLIGMGLLVFDMFAFYSSQYSAAKILLIILFVALMAALLGFGLFKLIQFFVNRKADAAYAQARKWLDQTDLGLIIADQHRWEPIREKLREQPWYRGFMPECAHTLEARLERAAVCCELLHGIAGGESSNLPGVAQTALHYRSSSRWALPCSFIGWPCSLATCLTGLLGSPAAIIGILLLPVSLSLAGSYITFRARLMAVCDFFLMDNE